MKPYTAFQFLYPPRPASKIGYDISSPAYQAWMKAPDVIAQDKLNGSRNIIFISPERDVKMYGRDGLPHKSYVAPEWLKQEIRQLKLPSGWNVLDSELMHLKTPSVKNTIYLYDVLVWGGQYLLGATYTERYKFIQDWHLPLFPHGDGRGGLSLPGPIKIISGGLFSAENIAPLHWDQAFQATGGNTLVKGGDVYEGLVLKQTGPLSALETGFREENNGGWMTRLRRPHKNFQN